MSGKREALRRVPRTGFDVQGQPVNKNRERIIDVNKIIGATTNVHWGTLQTGTEPILEKGYDITDPSSSTSSNSLQKGAVLEKPSNQKGANLPNEALADGEKRSEAVVDDQATSGSSSSA